MNIPTEELEKGTGKKVVPVKEHTETAPLIDEVDANTTYMGYAPRGTNVATDGWRIERISYNASVPADYPTTGITAGTGTETIIEVPNGDYGYGYNWNDRATYTYSR